MAKLFEKIFLSISSFQILAMFRRGLFYSFLSIYIRHYLGLSVTETTLFATLPMVANVLTQNLLWGRLSDKYQLRRTLIIIGEITAAVITVSVWYAHTLPETKYIAGYVLIIGLSIVEAFWSMSNVGWSALLSDLYPARDRAGIQGRLQSIGAVGRFGGVLIGGLLYDGYPFQYEGYGFQEGPLFFIASGVMLLSTIPMLFIPEGGIAKGKDQGKPNQMISPSILDGFRTMSRKYATFLLSVTFIFFGMHSIVLLKSQYLTLEGGFDVSSKTLSYIVNMATIGLFLFGMTIRRLSEKIKDEYLLLFGTGVAIVYLIGFGFAPVISLVYVSDFLNGVAMAIIFATSYAYASRLIPPEHRGKQFAIFNATHFLSWGLPGTLFAGPLVDYLISRGYTEVFSYKMAFVFAAVMVATGALILIWTIRKENGGKGQ